MKGICFSCAASRRASGKQNPNSNKEFSEMQKTEHKPLFDLGQLVATSGALAALEKSGQSPMNFLSRHLTGDWAKSPKKTERKTNSAWRGASHSSAAIAQPQATAFGSSPKEIGATPHYCYPMSIDFKTRE